MTATQSVVIIRFPQPSRAYQAASELRGLGESLTSVELRGAALVERTPEGTLRVPEQRDDIVGTGSAAGGLAGMLVGVLGGPLGVLLGFGAGALAGGMVDVDRMTSVDSALAVLSQQIPPGTTALIVDAVESTPNRSTSWPPASRPPSSGSRPRASRRRPRPPRSPPRRRRRKPRGCCASTSGPRSTPRSNRRSRRSRTSCTTVEAWPPTGRQLIRRPVWPKGRTGRRPRRVGVSRRGWCSGGRSPAPWAC